MHLREVTDAVDATTSGGSVFASFTGAPAGRLETSGGSIDVRFPQAAGVDLDAQTRGGRVAVALPFVLVQEERRRDRIGPRNWRRDRVVGSINGGGASLRLRTAGGDISVGAL